MYGDEYQPCALCSCLRPPGQLMRLRDEEERTLDVCRDRAFCKRAQAGVSTRREGAVRRNGVQRSESEVET
jgi:hypothetical protein